MKLSFWGLSTHTPPKNTPIEHLMSFYTKFSKIKSAYYDGMIITGAPVEMMPFEEVKYWNELTNILDWARKHVTSTFYICWGAQAALYHFFGINKFPLEKSCLEFSATRSTIPLFLCSADSTMNSMRLTAAIQLSMPTKSVFIRS